jgi:geranylgeranyl diphosphate synthase, type II
LTHDLDHYLKERRVKVDAHLNTALSPAAGFPESLREAMRYSLLAPGKRLRPLLVILAAEACGGTIESALPSGSAVEMVHTYSLIHDDLPAMDDDDLRRGLPTCHKKFGEAMAILAGDALLTMAFEVLAAGHPPRTAAASCRELAVGAGAAGMVGGQVDDLAWERRVEDPSAPPRTLDGLQFLHARKTGALFRASLRMGAYAAQGERPNGPDPKLLDAFDGYGRCFGLAFQITDDVLDVRSSAEEAGKRVNKDAARGKLTYPGLLGVDESRSRAEQLCREAVEHLAPLGRGAERLAALVRTLIERNK